MTDSPQAKIELVLGAQDELSQALYLLARAKDDEDYEEHRIEKAEVHMKEAISVLQTATENEIDFSEPIRIDDNEFHFSFCGCPRCENG